LLSKKFRGCFTTMDSVHLGVTFHATKLTKQEIC
jgi:hypothetical protein